jgi:hypothetical protein
MALQAAFVPEGVGLSEVGWLAGDVTAGRSKRETWPTIRVVVLSPETACWRRGWDALLVLLDPSHRRSTVIVAVAIAECYGRTCYIESSSSSV